MTSSASLELHDVHKSYRSTPVLRGVNLTVQPGTITALLGDNGAGKSTLIKCCVGLEKTTSGHILINGQPAAATPNTRAHVGVMLQEGGLPTTSTPKNFLNQLAGFYRNPIPPQELISSLDISSFANRTHRRLSGGQRQRVSLAAALLGRPHLAFLDEPTAGMDSQARNLVATAIRNHVNRGGAVVLTTHQLEDAASWSDNVAVLHDGQVIAEGSADTIAEQTGSRSTLITLRTKPNATQLNQLRQALPDTRQPQLTNTNGQPQLHIPHWLTTTELHTLTTQLLATNLELVTVTYATPTLSEAFNTIKTNNNHDPNHHKPDHHSPTPATTKAAP